MKFPNFHFLVPLLGIAISVAVQGQPVVTETYGDWIQQMKRAERGPFSRIRWFCNDGTILPPEPYACRDHGGGRQHGELGQHAQVLRDNGYLVANVLSALPPPVVLADNAEQLKWILLERYLVAIDDGWILRGARYYRGALQGESEAEAAKSILLDMLDTPRYLASDYLLTREAVRLLPWRNNSLALDRARALVITIADNDTGFVGLRNKIHSYPEPADISAVHDYVAKTTDSAQLERLRQLVSALESTFSSPDIALQLAKFADTINAEIANEIRGLSSRWAGAESTEARHAIAGRILISLRTILPELTVSQRLSAIQLSLTTEAAAYAEAVQILADSQGRSRAWQLERLSENIDILYGMGFLTQREWQAQKTSLAEPGMTMQLKNYQEKLAYIERLPGWVASRFNFFFARPMTKLMGIESRSAGFIQDRLRGSPLLLYGQILEDLAMDLARLTGASHELFGRSIASGLRALNPGIARGPLQAYSEDDNAQSVIRDKPVILAPETIADLPPVAGILTVQEGNALSHIQLLARNLGIPNVVVDRGLLPEIEARIGSEVVLLSSPGGIVRMDQDSAVWDRYFTRQEEKPASIRIDLDKLDLDDTRLFSLDDLRATDSGRVVGPKAAKLGELKMRFPDMVSAGLAIPFGVFRRHLQQEMEPGGPTLYDWMVTNYNRLEQIPDTEIRQSELHFFLTEVRDRISRSRISTDLQGELKQRMEAVFGADGSYGVFVRSDTNVEDLPGFTGAGLNLTVPNVIGYANILDAIKAVWASPFTERAYGWRQALMEQPEHVYAAVLLHKTVPAEKSGVMITADINTNEQDVYSIVVNEGVGGGVDGQSAETLLLDSGTGAVKLLTSATEPDKRILPPDGGVRMVAASGNERVLADAEITQLLDFGRKLPERYPEIIDAEGQHAPADIEFAFSHGKLYLIQIRPFLQSNRALRNQLLNELDIPVRRNLLRTVNLTEEPEIQ